MPKHVLCADDSVTMQKVVAITFANSEFQVIQARSADEALALAKTHRPDLVLADAAMPGRSGYDLCQALKSDPATRNVPVIILCGNSSPYDEVRGRSVGADSFLVKPWDTTTFLEKLGEIVSRAATQGAMQPTARTASIPPVGGPAPAVGPHVVSRPSSIPPPPKPATLQGTAPQNPTMMGMPRPVPPAAPPPPVAARPIPAPPAGLPKPPPGLPRPPLIRGAVVGSGVRPSAAMPRVSGALPVHPSPVVAPGAARTPPPPAPQRAPVVAPPAAATPPPPAPSPQATGPLPPAANQPRPASIRSATIMGMPAVSTPPAAPSHSPGPVAAAPSPASPIAPRGEPTPPPAPPKPAPVTISPPVVARSTSGVMPATPVAPAAPRVAPQPAAAAPAPPPAAAAADGRGPEYDAIMKLSREIIERICWEVVPELAEALLRENMNKLQK